MLSGHQPEPGSELTAIAEYASIANASYEGTRGQGANAGNFGEPTARLVALVGSWHMKISLRIECSVQFSKN